MSRCDVCMHPSSVCFINLVQNVACYQPLVPQALSSLLTLWCSMLTKHHIPTLSFMAALALKHSGCSTDISIDTIILSIVQCRDALTTVWYSDHCLVMEVRQCIFVVRCPLPLLIICFYISYMHYPLPFTSRGAWAIYACTMQYHSYCMY